MTVNKGFKFSIDRGGTFTDVYAEVPGEKGFRVVKLLSEDPANYDDAPREGIRRVLEDVTGTSIPADAVPTDSIDWIRMGTTVATNALLERQGARTALVTTKGMGDVLKIGNQDRPQLFDLQINKPDQLYETVIEVEERVRLLRADTTEHMPATGRCVTGVTGEELEILREPDLDVLRPQLQAVLDSGITSLAVVFLHSYAFNEHEKAVGKLAEELGFTQISLSSEVSPTVKLVPRGDTTMVDAYLNPHIQQYLASFRKGFASNFEDTNLLFMQSDGGLTPADEFSGSRAILSGPAGGVVGYASTTYDEIENQPVIGFDMGGTSTDVSRFGGDYELTFETETAGVRIQAPQLEIKTVAAGGGSRLFFENGMFLVGPESAGAHPGPICYRKNGYLTVTDANLVLGRIRPEYFPHIFGVNEDEPLDYDAAFEAMSEMADKVNAYNKERNRSELSVEEVALGFLQVANEVMVRPIREISVMRGFDIKEHVLATFGGAGPQHACAIARSLGIKRIFIHRFAGILSAYGMGLADVVAERRQPYSATYAPAAIEDALAVLKTLQEQAEDELKTEGFSQDRIASTRYMNLRYSGTDTAIMVAEPDNGDYAASFREVYQREFGFDLGGRDILVDDLRVRSRGLCETVKSLEIGAAGDNPPSLGKGKCYFQGGGGDVPLYNLEDLGAGHRIEGPAIIIHDTSTIVIEPDCNATITEHGDISIDVLGHDSEDIGTTVDPVQLSIFSNLFMSIAEQMGRMLQKTAISTNIKERCDFSCALFDAEGSLVANAPHVPVHLGAMSAAVREQIRRRKGDLKPGDVLVSNHPMAGGSHLPDITVITPVFRDGEIIFWVASRGHHADIGGISPGSMPPNSRTLEEEGACITSFKLVKDNVFQEEGILELLKAPGDIDVIPGRPVISGSRAIADNLSDLKAQTAANRKGIDLVLEMVDRYGLDVIQAYMKYVQDAAEEAVRGSLKELSESRGLAETDTVQATDYLDDGSPIALKLTIDRKDGSASFDFTGTGSEIWGNCNAPEAVTRSAILYCLRCLVDKDLPLNDGCLKPVSINIPKGSLLSPSEHAAVVGGNVLTSQRITDVILRAFGVAAASQGCMNNFTFGDENFGYYETIGGGAGAGPTWAGRSGVHTHMTNTRITDAEILERRYPVLLRQFAIRKGSGGDGKNPGGDGLVRELEFLKPLFMAILSERRVYAPYGIEGGSPGKQGCNTFITKDGRHLNLGGKNEVLAQAGDCFRIETPGGGGYGE